MPDSVIDDAVRNEIARRAYEKFCGRGCHHGSDIEDWLAAERDVLAEQARPLMTAVAAADAPRRRGRKT